MKHIREFDGLRGVLACWVMLTHVIYLSPYAHLNPHLHANWAVEVFIILSGFVIFHLLSLGEDYRTFITRRFFRLFPVFAICMGLALLVKFGLGLNGFDAFGVENDRHLGAHLVAHATMLHGLLPEQVLPHSALAYLPPAWSISLEWQFYLLAPVLFAICLRPRVGPFVLLIGLVLIRLLHQAWLLGPPLLPTAAPLDFGPLPAFLPLRLEFFFVGALSFFLWRQLERSGARFAHSLVPLGIAVALIALIMTRSLPMAAWTFLMFAIAEVHFGQPGISARLLSRGLKGRLWGFLGEISYSIYLVHMPIVALSRYLLDWMAPSLNAPLRLAAMGLVTVTMAVGAAWIMNRVVERPMIRQGKNLALRWKERRQGAVLAAPSAQG